MKLSEIKLSELRVMQDKVLVTELEFGDKKTAGGLYVLDDDGKFDGVRPRWARVCAIGPKQEKIKLNDYVLIQHGRWTRAIPVEDTDGSKIKVFMIDYPAGVLMITQERPAELELLIKG